MSFEIRVGGMIISASGTGQLLVRTEAGAVVSPREFAAIAAFVQTLSEEDPGARGADRFSQRDLSPRASVAVAMPSRMPVTATADDGGFRHTVPTRTGPSLVAAADQARTGATGAAVLPGRPRTTALGVVPPRPSSSEAPTAAESPAAADIAGPSGPPALPGRPRTIGLAPAIKAAPAAQGAGGSAATAEPAAPGRERAAAPKAPTPAAVEVVKVAPPRASRGRSERLVDQFDAWMKTNPGPKTREELIKVAIENRWLTPEDSRRLFAVCMNRERNLFNRMMDGSTEIYIRRAEATQTAATPGKVVRRPGGRPRGLR